jgi:hypothetical protein
MAKAHLTLPGGTTVTIEGTPDEVHRLLQLSVGEVAPTKRGRTPPGTPSRARKASADSPESDGPDLTAIVNLVKECPEADGIETNILNRTSVIDRVLLPLHIFKKHAKSAAGLTSGEIARVTRELGVPVSQPNASTALSGTASKYVMGDKVRRRGQPVRYRISRRGEQYLASVIDGKPGEK